MAHLKKITSAANLFASDRSTSRVNTVCRRRGDLVTFTGTLDELLRYILKRWPYNWPSELHAVTPCNDPRPVTIRRIWLTTVMAELAEQWPDVKRALQNAGFLSADIEEDNATSDK